VADSIANAEAVRAFARERDEAAIHAANVREFGKKTLRSWDYQNFRVNTITAPMYVLTNTLGLIVALHISLYTAASLETVFLTFTYFATATRVMWEFNRGLDAGRDGPGHPWSQIGLGPQPPVRRHGLPRQTGRGVVNLLAATLRLERRLMIAGDRTERSPNVRRLAFSFGRHELKWTLAVVEGSLVPPPPPPSHSPERASRGDRPGQADRVVARADGQNRVRDQRRSQSSSPLAD
jgi:hypothetical protein